MKVDNNNDLKKYFDSKEYITTIIGVDNTNEQPDVKEDKITSVISLLTDPSNKYVKEDTLITLKKENRGDILLLAIASPKAKDNKHALVAACWESEINFSKYLSFFILLALDSNYLVSLEAITVIENMAGPFEQEIVKDAIKKIKAAQKNIAEEKVILFNDLIFTLEGFIGN